VRFGHLRMTREGRFDREAFGQLSRDVKRIWVEQCQGRQFGELDFNGTQFDQVTPE
jgi:hypothetical protein